VLGWWLAFAQDGLAPSRDSTLCSAHSFLPPASTPTIRRQCFSAQFVRRYHKDTAWFWIRHVYDSKISPCIRLPDGYSRSFFALTILTWSCQYFLHFVLNDIVIVSESSVLGMHPIVFWLTCA